MNDMNDECGTNTPRACCVELLVFVYINSAVQVASRRVDVCFVNRTDGARLKHREIKIFWCSYVEKIS